MKCDLCGRMFEKDERFKFYNYYEYRYNMTCNIPPSYPIHLSNRKHYDKPDNFGLYLCFNCDSDKLKVNVIEIPKHLPKEQYKRFALTILRKGT